MTSNQTAVSTQQRLVPVGRAGGVGGGDPVGGVLVRSVLNISHHLWAVWDAIFSSDRKIMEGGRRCGWTVTRVSGNSRGHGAASQERN